MFIYTSVFATVLSSRINSVVEPPVIIPQEVINIPEYYEKDVDLGCMGQANLPNGGRFSSPGWDEQFVYANNMNCTWILGRQGCTTEVDFYEIDIEDLHLLRKCPYDKLSLKTYDRQLYKELCGRSPPEIFRVFGPIEVKFTSDKTVQRRGWTAAVNVYNCNYPHLEDKRWKLKGKKAHFNKNHVKKTTALPTTVPTTTTQTTIASSTLPTITTTVMTTTPRLTTIPTTSMPLTTDQVVYETTEQQNNEQQTTVETLLGGEEELSKIPADSFEALEDRLTMTLDRLENWARNMSAPSDNVEVQILEESSDSKLNSVESSGFDGSGEIHLLEFDEGKNLDMTERELNSVDYNPTDYLADVYLQFRGDVAP